MIVILHHIGEMDMFKQFTAILLLFAITVQTFHKAIIVIDFYRNQEYIAKNLCENRFRPMLHCDGHCLLAKKLQQAEKKEQRNPDLKGENKQEVVSSKSFYPVIATTTIEPVTPHNSFNKGKPVDFAEDFFHPPGA
ncbi:hypothetical protein EV199_4163 [Pseudobacter ginsenosidimutans]|uniref:Uncharacterized protein n=2 Tax=Pseudobacter ginsenosidimutans TaxID=661488 RepID=A0A4Q7MUB8_9BACT|nr:hypothetical protein EV199_4163 [Pseudobacter ginsenosidimutans]